MSAARVGPPTEPPRVAYAVGRNVGGAVVRNRVRRQLRAAVDERRAVLEPGYAYLIRATPAATNYAYAEISRAVDDGLRALMVGAL